MDYSIIFGGGFEYPEHSKLFVLKYKRKFIIKTFDSFGYCKWNGGRMNHGVKFNEDVLRFYNKNNIGVFLTFTNDIIDISDPEGNFYLEKLNKCPLNGIILVNDKLKEYIKDKFKNLKLTRSITYFRSDFTPLDILDYQNAQKEFDLVVPRRIDVENPDFYNNIDKDKCEVLFSDDCPKQCPKMREHFNLINRYNRGEDVEFSSNCLLKHNEKKRLDIALLKKIGYKNFKISSRMSISDTDVFLDNLYGDLEALTNN